MGYVAVRGGEGAIARVEQFLQAERTGGVADLLRPEQIRDILAGGDGGAGRPAGR